MGIELSCPRCGAALAKSQYQDRIGFSCPEGHGIAMTLGAMRALCGSRELVNLLWHKSGEKECEGQAACPICGRPMSNVTLDVKGQALELDICRRCQEVWFDPNELETLPPPPPRPEAEELPQAVREKIAIEKAKNVRFDDGDRSRIFGRNADKEIGDALFRDNYTLSRDWGDVGSPFKYLAAVFGFPVEEDAPPLQKLPLVTWGLMFACVAIFALTCRGLDGYAKEWGFIPAEFARTGGATWVTSMFMHAGIVHLVGNMYFLWVFGDNVEDELGKINYLGFILLSGFSATLLHLLLKPGSTIPCVGASGFISGIIAMYAVLYPQVTILIGIRFRLIGLPACIMFLVWLIFQTVMAWLDTRHGCCGGVAYAAHLGGAIPGIACGLILRIVRARRAETQYGQW